MLVVRPGTRLFKRRRVRSAYIASTSGKFIPSSANRFPTRSHCQSNALQNEVNDKSGHFLISTSRSTAARPATSSGWVRACIPPTSAAEPCTDEAYVLGNLYYGFAQQRFYIRVDPVADAMSDIHDFQMRLTLWDSRETRITLRVADRKVAQCVVEQEGACLLHPAPVVSAAYGKILEVSLARELFDLKNRRELLLSVALWEGGLPLDVLPVEGMLQVPLGEENYAWPAG